MWYCIVWYCTCYEVEKWPVFIPIFLYVDVLEDSSEEEDSNNEVEVEIDEETIIKYYFQRGFCYEEIIHFLAKRHTLAKRQNTPQLK